MTPNIAAAKAALSHLDIEEKDSAIKAKSRDFFWYSPVLKDRLDHVVADFVVSPRSEAEVIEVLKTCYAHNVPVTTRGAGTGNYGQAMPLAGGCVMHLHHMNAVKEIQPGRVIVEPGCLLKDLDAACRADSGQELRMFSSTWATASIGGFIAGGSGGVGSCTWGSLRDLGNIIRLRVVTMEEEPRVLNFRGEELARVSHAYGTNGIITEIEVPLAPAYDWVEMFVAFDDFMGAATFAEELANQDGILIKLASVYEAPVAHDYFQRVRPYVTADKTLVGLMVAPHSMDGFDTFVQRRPQADVIYRSDSSTWERTPGAVFEYGWNHTTLRALKVDPSITYLQVRYGFPEHLGLVEKLREMFSPEVLQHLEVLKENGKVMFAGLSLVKFTTEERLEEIIRLHEEAGAMIFNPHRYTLEEGGRQTVDDRQLRFKKESDPKGLLNPGKMISWDDPDWGYDRMYAYPKLQAAD
ncbi:FAD-binding oxidoreductase [Meridianimarinicoccus aquatilis]|uniref:FAD-binding oxidoreductase n=1 Tax=Meridianimarinicoccus aquatilis TaxID=2552766 RepID=A0A4R6B1L8_9RHOB|nr:FAD-binding oxidoreductase [Fluviibacterium aquatile]QIE40547.1 FAD-binding oxidoreductase [Rhodobacteraceae bacterium SC52]TDL91051.1 FAD-binding oxidoreductase [Fluviibacterium aquatile]